MIRPLSLKSPSLLRDDREASSSQQENLTYSDKYTKLLQFIFSDHSLVEAQMPNVIFGSGAFGNYQVSVLIVGAPMMGLVLL